MKRFVTLINWLTEAEVVYGEYQRMLEGEYDNHPLLRFRQHVARILRDEYSLTPNLLAVALEGRNLIHHTRPSSDTDAMFFEDHFSFVTHGVNYQVYDYKMVVQGRSVKMGPGLYYYCKFFLNPHPQQPLAEGA